MLYERGAIEDRLQSVQLLSFLSLLFHSNRIYMHISLSLSKIKPCGTYLFSSYI